MYYLYIYNNISLTYKALTRCHNASTRSHLCERHGAPPTCSEGCQPP